MERKYCVYCHISPSGKKYVGVTCRKPEKRWNYGNGYKDNSYFYRAIQKYGWNSFEHVVLVRGLTEEEASRLEKRLIALFDLTNRSKGYNLDLGGISTGKRLSEETKKKIGDVHRGRYTEAQWEATKNRKPINYRHTDEAKKRIGDSHRGKPLSDEHKAKLSKAHQGMKPSNLEALRKSNEKVVEKYDMNGNLVCKYNSLKEAAEANHTLYQCISACCRGKTSMAAGFAWRYAV